MIGAYLCLRGNISLTPGPGNQGQKQGEILHRVKEGTRGQDKF